jgi:D-aspartate ligase
MPTESPPLILAGANVVTALPIVRSLGRAGVDVRLLCWPQASPAASRYGRRLPADGAGPQQEAWAAYLLGPAAEALRGAVLLACSDDAIEFLLEHREALAERYLLDVCDPTAQRAMLDKLATYRAAHEAGIPTPRFWPADGEDQILAHAGEYSFPLMIKPLYAHQFKEWFAGKYLMARDMAELLEHCRATQRHRVEVVLLEVIPGPDDLLCSYYTYLDDAGEPHFHFTKRIIRRYPEREGFGCYHITDWNPEVAELGLRLFKHAGLRGVANVEFKRDPRDGVLKLIECNARFTAANVLLTASGIDLGAYVYRRLAGLQQAPLGDVDYRKGMRLWYPVDDFLAFLELHRGGRLGTGAWLCDIAHRQVLPVFAWDDPMPALVGLRDGARTLAVTRVKRAVRGLVGRD